MSQNVTWLGNSYSNVPFIDLPKTGGGTARFDDASVTTATAADVAIGKTFLAADGTITNGALAFSTIHTGSSAPSSSLGVNGDIYLQTS